MEPQSQPVFGGQSYTNPNGGNGFGNFGMPVNTGGDVVFSSEGNASTNPGGNKKIIMIVAVLVGLVAVGGLLVWLLLGGGGGGLFGSSELAGLEELRTFIIDGDEETKKLFEKEYEEADDGTENYIMAVKIAKKDRDDIKKYYEKLRILEQSFYEQSGKRLDEDSLNEYINMLKILRNAIDYQTVRSELITMYEDGKDDGAKGFYDENIKCSDDLDGELTVVCELEEKYYMAVLTEHKVYAEAGCYKNGEYDIRCAKDYYGVVEFEIKRAEGGYTSEYLNGLEEKHLELSSEFLQLDNSLAGEK